VSRDNIVFPSESLWPPVRQGMSQHCSIIAAHMPWSYRIKYFIQVYRKSFYLFRAIDMPLYILHTVVLLYIIQTGQRIYSRNHFPRDTQHTRAISCPRRVGTCFLPTAGGQTYRSSRVDSGLICWDLCWTN
jgi:hypothetical protein